MSAIISAFRAFDATELDVYIAIGWLVAVVPLMLITSVLLYKKSRIYNIRARGPTIALLGQNMVFISFFICVWVNFTGVCGWLALTISIHMSIMALTFGLRFVVLMFRMRIARKLTQFKIASSAAAVPPPVSDREQRDDHAQAPVGLPAARGGADVHEKSSHSDKVARSGDVTTTTRRPAGSVTSKDRPSIVTNDSNHSNSNSNRPSSVGVGVDHHPQLQSGQLERPRAASGSGGSGVIVRPRATSGSSTGSNGASHPQPTQPGGTGSSNVAGRARATSGSGTRGLRGSAIMRPRAASRELGPGSGAVTGMSAETSSVLSTHPQLPALDTIADAPSSASTPSSISHAPHLSEPESPEHGRQFMMAPSMRMRATSGPEHGRVASMDAVVGDPTRPRARTHTRNGGGGVFGSFANPTTRYSFQDESVLSLSLDAPAGAMGPPSPTLRPSPEQLQQHSPKTSTPSAPGSPRRNTHRVTKKRPTVEAFKPRSDDVVLQIESVDEKSTVPASSTPSTHSSSSPTGNVVVPSNSPSPTTQTSERLAPASSGLGTDQSAAAPSAVPTVAVVPHSHNSERRPTTGSKRRRTHETSRGSRRGTHSTHRPGPAHLTVQLIPSIDETGQKATAPLEPMVAIPSVQTLLEGEGSWFIRHRHWMQRRFLSVVVVFALVFLLSVPLALHLAPTPNNSCDEQIEREQIWVAIVILADLVLMIGISCGAHLSSEDQDAFGIRQEMRLNGVLLALMLTASMVTLLTLNDSYVTIGILVAFILCLWINSTVWPLYVSRRRWKETQLTQSGLVNVETLKDLLEIDIGYNSFLLYTSREFAQENVLFWKRVTEFQNKYGQTTYRALLKRDECLRDAESIMKEFVFEMAPSQVNIPSRVYAKLCRAWKAETEGTDAALASSTPRHELAGHVDPTAHFHFTKSPATATIATNASTATTITSSTASSTSATEMVSIPVSPPQPSSKLNSLAEPLISTTSLTSSSSMIGLESKPSTRTTVTTPAIASAHRQELKPGSTNPPSIKDPSKPGHKHKHSRSMSMSRLVGMMTLGAESGPPQVTFSVVAIFDQALAEVYRLMVDDLLPRYLQSPEFFSFLDEMKRRAVEDQSENSDEEDDEEEESIEKSRRKKTKRHHSTSRKKSKGSNASRFSRNSSVQQSKSEAGEHGRAGSLDLADPTAATLTMTSPSGAIVSLPSSPATETGTLTARGSLAQQLARSSLKQFISSSSAPNSPEAHGPTLEERKRASSSAGQTAAGAAQPLSDGLGGADKAVVGGSNTPAALTRTRTESSAGADNRPRHHSRTSRSAHSSGVIFGIVIGASGTAGDVSTNSNSGGTEERKRSKSRSGSRTMSRESALGLSDTSGL